MRQLAILILAIIFCFRFDEEAVRQAVIWFLSLSFASDWRRMPIRWSAAVLCPDFCRRTRWPSPGPCAGQAVIPQSVKRKPSQWVKFRPPWWPRDFSTVHCVEVGSVSVPSPVLCYRGQGLSLCTVLCRRVVLSTTVHYVRCKNTTAQVHTVRSFIHTVSTWSWGLGIINVRCKNTTAQGQIIPSHCEHMELRPGNHKCALQEHHCTGSDHSFTLWAHGVEAWES